MMHLKATQTVSRIIAALLIGSLLVACGGGSSTTPGVSSLVTTLTAPSGASSNVTGSISSDTVNNWGGNFAVGTDLLVTFTGAGTTVGSAKVSSSNSSTAIITLTVSGMQFTALGTSINSTQYNALVAAGSTLIVEFVDSNNVTYSSALTRN